MSKPPEIDRKSLKDPDVFVKQGTSWISKLAKYQSKLFPIAVLAFVLVVGGYGFEWWNSRKLDQAWRAYHEAAKQTDPAKWDALKAMVEKHPKTRATYFAAVELGDHYFDEAKKALVKEPNQIPASLEDVVKWFSKALELGSILPSEKQLLLINRASAYEMQKKLDEAEKDLKTAQDLGQELKGLALLNSARILELKNDPAKAIETYEKVAADFLNTEYSKMAKNHARRLKSPTFKN